MNRLSPASSLVCGLLLFALPDMARAAPAGVVAKQKADLVNVFDFWEVCLQVAHPDAPNPFTDVEVSGEVTPPGGAPVRVDGFCNAADGSLFGLRFMPSQAGEHSFTITFRQGNFSAKQPVLQAIRVDDAKTPRLVAVALKNPQMADGKEQPEHWTDQYVSSGKIAIRRDLETYHSAPAALRIETVGGAAEGQVTQAFSARPGDTFQLTGYISAAG